MANRTLPRNDAPLLSWATNFVAHAAPNPGSVGLDAQQVAELDARRATFETALAATTVPAMRSSFLVSQKNAARDACRTLAARLAAIVSATAGVSDATKIQLGLTVRAAAARRVDAPAQPPVVTVTSVEGRTVRYNIGAAGEAGPLNRRGRARGCIGVIAHSYVGEKLPDSGDVWRFEGVTSATSLSLTFPDDVPAGSRVWLSVAWLSPTLETGPASRATSAHLGGGGMTLARGLRRVA